MKKHQKSIDKSCGRWYYNHIKRKNNQSTKDIKYQKGFGDSGGKVDFYSSIWKWQESCLLQERPGTVKTIYRFLYKMNVLFYMKNNKYRYYSSDFSYWIMSQNWYKGFGICVKKHFSKEYNHYLRESSGRRVPENFENR